MKFLRQLFCYHWQVHEEAWHTKSILWSYGFHVFTCNACGKVMAVPDSHVDIWLIGRDIVFKL